MAGPMESPRLRRSRDERVLFGVCGGLAEYRGWDPTLVRAGTVLAALFPPTSVVALIGYVLLAVILPEEGSEHLSARDRVRRNLETMRTDVGDLKDTVRSGVRGAKRDRRADDRADYSAPAVSNENEFDRAA